MPVRTSSQTVGSRSTKTARGTCLPAPVSEKKVLNAPCRRAADRLVQRHLAVRLDAMLEAVELPAGVADLDAALVDVDGDHLTHG